MLGIVRDLRVQGTQKVPKTEGKNNWAHIFKPKRLAYFKA